MCIIQFCSLSWAGPQRGVPNHLADLNSRVGRVPVHQVPTLQAAIAAYQATGGNLSPAMQFGSDPIGHSSELLLERTRALEANIASPEDLFSFTVNGVYQPFADSLQFMIHKTHQLSMSG